MKNLQAIIRRNIDFKSGAVGFCEDSDIGILYVLTDESKLIKTHIYDENIIFDEQSLAEKLDTLTGLRHLTQNDVRLFEFVVEVGGLLLALKSGHLLIIDVSTTDCHCIYKHERNLSSISLSPSQDLIALADEANDIQVMYCSGCEIIHQSNALTQNESLHKPVGVGWGSKETQFFGLDGRPSQEKKQPTQVQLSAEEVVISDQIEADAKFNDFQRAQQRSTVIDWRGDGQLIATLTYLPESNKHYLKVWNRNLELQYMSEQLVNVERGLLCWIPDGRYICCAQRRDRRLNELAIFEKNGLVRQRISLPSFMADTYISSMAWSSDSKIFAIIVKQFDISDGKVQFYNILMLYTMQNWHYYLKSSVKLKNDCDYSMKWDASIINRFHIISSDGLYVEYDCCFQVTYSERHSTVAVVDANKVLVTPLEKCIMPPPMSAITLETKIPVYKLAIDHQANIFILTLNGHLICTSMDSNIDDASKDAFLSIHFNNQICRKLYDSSINFRVFTLDDVNCYQHLVAIDGHTLIASKLSPTGSEIIQIKLPENQSGELALDTLQKFEKRQVVCISRNISKHSKSLNVILNDSSSFLLDFSGLSEPSLDFKSFIADSKFSYNVIDMQTVNVSSNTAMISLGQDFCLRSDKDILASNCCTSFRLTKNYLIYTTTENSIQFILLKNLSDTSLRNKSDSWSQPIESGGTLIIASENETKVVLQMPRGNLETIHPRVLLFSKLTVLLDERKYVEACKLARRHRVNMNFLVDYLARIGVNYESHWSDFAETIANYDPNLLCLIITELDNIDTISGRYQSVIKHIPSRQADIQQKKEITDKVNKFCSNINLPTKPEFLNPRIQCLLRMEPKLTSEALKIVHDLNQDSRMNAIKYILYFIDIEQLFKDALSTYNSDIALMVASASNKDPKEYLALLDRFNGIESTSRRCFEIDLHIKRYNEAFNHLYSLSSSEVHDDPITREDLIEFVVSKRIYRHAICHLQSLINQTQTYDFEGHFVPESITSSHLIYDIWAKYADYLLEKRHYDEAGLAYSKAFNGSGKSTEYFNSALKCYSFTEDWEKSMALIVRSQIGLETRREASRKLARQLLERGKHHEALIVELLISKNFEGDIEWDALLGLASAGNWFLAEILAGDQREQFVKIGEHIDLFEQVSSQIFDWLVELKVAVEQFERLKVVLTTQETKQDLLAEKGFISDSLSTVDGSELSSMSGADGHQVAKVARSGATSIKTRSSSKSNRSNHKRINLKIGSRHEDIALILELKKFISRQKTLQEECAKYSATLYQYLASTQNAHDKVNRFKTVVNHSLEFAQDLVQMFWPTGPHLEQTYSLYKRLNTIIQTETSENVDFEILIRPELPKCLNLFEL